jgi:alpha-amylase/alpha-mannosidase (GH57 family)
MVTVKPLPVLFLWHHHQPQYRSPTSSWAWLPWVRLHAARGYTDMAAVCEDEGAQVTFNLTPILLEQIAQQAEAPVADEFERVSRVPVHDLTEEERCFILEHFFSVNWDTLLRPWPRYAQLLSLRGERADKAEICRKVGDFSDGDILDLTVLFHLAWIGFTGRKRPEIHELIQKGQKFTEEDRVTVLGVHRQLLQAVVPTYRRLWEKGVVELTTSPYAHPILPLLCDGSVAFPDLPKGALPRIAFRHPEDANGQLALARQIFEQHFGKPSNGLWPSEGSLSEEALSLIASNEFHWTATDEENLYRSRIEGSQVSDAFAPFAFRAGEREITLFFRDKRLSDAIGFQYSRSRTEDSISDFCGRLRRIESKTQGRANRCVAVILDGENPWEYFPDGGEDFLRGLFRALTKEPRLSLSTYSNHIAGMENPQRIISFHPGSWIDANFHIWIGDPLKNRAWDLLRKIRRQLETQVPENLEKNEATRRALYLAEGSDWFWWFGEPFSSPYKPDFDKLFRSFLQDALTAAGLETPSVLDSPIAPPVLAEVATQPTFEMTPVLDGRVTSFYEWVGAVCLDTRKFGATMGQTERVIEKIYYGFDLHSFYLRIDLSGESVFTKSPPLTLLVEVFGEETTAFAWPLERGREPVAPRVMRRTADTAVLVSKARCATNGIAEISIPFDEAGVVQGSECSFAVSISEGDLSRDRVPREGVLRFKVLSIEELAANWTI